MASSNNFLSLYGAIDSQGILITPNSPLLEDITPNQIFLVMPETIVDYLGNSRACFKVYFQNPKGLSYQFVYLPLSDGITTIAGFLTALNNLSTNNQFTQYDNLLFINGAPVTGSPSILLNDVFVNRIYFPDGNPYAIGYTNTTNCYIVINNTLQKWAVTVDGDQTTAGEYTYFGQ